MVSFMTNRGKFEVGSVAVSGTTDLRLLLVDTAQTAAAAQDFNFVSDIVADAIAGDPRRDLASVTYVENDTNDRAEIDAADPAVYTGLNGPTIAGGYIYRFVTTDADSPLWAFLEVNDIVTNGGDVTLSFPALGFIHVT